MWVLTHAWSQMTGLTYFCSAVDILYVEDTAEAVEQHLGEGGHQLGGGD